MENKKVANNLCLSKKVKMENIARKLGNVFQRTLDKLLDNELNYLEKMTVSKMLLKQITDSI